MNKLEQEVLADMIEQYYGSIQFHRDKQQKEKIKKSIGELQHLYKTNHEFQFYQALEFTNKDNEIINEVNEIYNMII